MLIGRGLSGLAGPVEGPELFPGQLRPGNTFETAKSVMTVGPMTIRPAASAAASAPAARGGLLAKDVHGKIWGLPPMVAYAIIAVTLTGAGLWTYQKIRGAGRGRRLAPNPPRRTGARGKRARYKR